MSQNVQNRRHYEFSRFTDFDMFKVFQYFESPSYAILLNSFYFSIFAFIQMLFCLICTWVCHKMFRIEDNMNFHGSLSLSSRKIARYFKSPYFLILLNSFSVFYLCLHKSVIGLHFQLHFSTNMRIAFARSLHF